MYTKFKERPGIMKGAEKPTRPDNLSRLVRSEKSARFFILLELGTLLGYIVAQEICYAHK